MGTPPVRLVASYGKEREQAEHLRVAHLAEKQNMFLVPVSEGQRKQIFASLWVRVVYSFAWIQQRARETTAQCKANLSSYS